MPVGLAARDSGPTLRRLSAQPFSGVHHFDAVKCTVVQRRPRPPPPSSERASRIHADSVKWTGVQITAVFLSSLT